MASTDWTAMDMSEMHDQTVVVTGANSGLGYEATKAFARKGARVILACRSVDRGKDAVRSIREGIPNASLAVGKLDLASLESIRRFAEKLLEEDTPIDILCNNAGVMAIPRTETEDGFETQFGVNHLGHFALTGLLLDRIRDTDGESRIVTHSSGVHERGAIDFDDLHSEQSYDKWDAYAQSKLANLLFAYELDRRLTQTDADTISIACHPGYAATNLQRRGPEMEGSQLKTALMGVANALFGQPAEQGAWPLLYAATHPELSGGEYVGPGGLLNMRGAPTMQESSDRSYDEADADRLWDVSTELTGVSYDF